MTLCISLIIEKQYIFNSNVSLKGKTDQNDKILKLMNIAIYRMNKDKEIYNNIDIPILDCYTLDFKLQILYEKYLANQQIK